jgi:hypothetical protein
MIMDDALKGGQSGAAKFEKQRMMLTQGPMASALGIKNSDDAAKMLEAMKAMQEGKTAPALSEGSRGLQDAMNKGTDIQAQNKTELAGVNEKLDLVERSTDVLAKGFTESHFGIITDKKTGKVEGLAGKRLEDMKKSAASGGKSAGEFAKQMGEAGVMKDGSNETRQKVVKDFQEWGNRIKDAFGGITKPFMDALKGGDQKKIATENDKIKEYIASQKKSGDPKKMAEAEALEKYRAQGMDLNSGILKPDMNKTSHAKHLKVPESSEQQNITPGQKVAQSAHGKPAAQKPGSGGGVEPGNYTHNVTHNGAETGTKIHVTVKVDKSSPNAGSITGNTPAP